MIKGETGFGRSTYDNITSIWHLHLWKGLAGHFMIPQQQDEILAGIYVIRRNTLFITIAFIAIGLLFAFTLLETLTILIIYAEICSRIGEGELIQRFQSERNDEFGVTSNALNKVVESIRSIV